MGAASHGFSQAEVTCGICNDPPTKHFLRPKENILVNRTWEVPEEGREGREHQAGGQDEEASAQEGAVEDHEEVQQGTRYDPVPLERKPIRMPSRAEQEVHRRYHLPFRSWCPECVAGRKPNWGHYSIPEENRARTCPEIHYDYCFFRSKEGGTSVPVIISKDRGSRAVSAHVVPHKGASVDWVVEQLKRDLAKWGIWDTVQIIVKCDNEFSLNDLIGELAKTRAEGRTVPENSQKGESESNGLIEAAVKGVEGMVRTLWIGLQKRLRVNLEVTHPIFAWVVEHAADLITRRAEGSDGQTAWQRLRTSI